MNEKDIERLKELEEAYNNCNDKKEKKKINKKIYYLKHKEKFRKRDKENYENNKKEIKEKQREYYENNKDKINLKNKLENDESRNQANNHRNIWTVEEIKLLYRYYIEENKTAKEIANLLERTIKSIYCQINKNQLNRTRILKNKGEKIK